MGLKPDYFSICAAVTMSCESSNAHDHHHDHHDTPDPPADAWRDSGVKVIPANSLDTATAQTPGMNRAAAINFARVGAQKLWAGTVTIHADAKTGAHHHGKLLISLSHAPDTFYLREPLPDVKISTNRLDK